MERWFLTMAAAVTAAAALAGCGGGRAGDAAGAERPPTSARTAPSPQAHTLEAAVMPCQAGWSFSADKRYFRRGWRRQAVIAGPIALLWLKAGQDADLRNRRALMVKVLLEPYATTTVAVAPEDRAYVSLSTRPPADPLQAPDGDPAIAFEGCAPRVDDTRKGEEQGTGYAIAVIVDGPRCATFEITPEGGDTMRRRAGFGQRCA